MPSPWILKNRLLRVCLQDDGWLDCQGYIFLYQSHEGSEIIAAHLSTAWCISIDPHFQKILDPHFPSYQRLFICTSIKFDIGLFSELLEFTNIVYLAKPSRYRSHCGIKLTQVIFPGQNSSRCLALLTGITLKPLERIAFEGTRPQFRGPRFRRQEARTVVRVIPGYNRCRTTDSLTGTFSSHEYVAPVIFKWFKAIASNGLEALKLNTSRRSFISTSTQQPHDRERRVH